jgi:hypothetical protein
MPQKQIKRMRKKKLRSYRKLMLFLWAFGVAGVSLGVWLIGWGIMADSGLGKLGVVYLLVAFILLGIRGVLGHLDDARRRKHVFRSSARTSS